MSVLDKIENVTHAEVSAEIDATMARLEILVAVQAAVMARDVGRLKQLAAEHAANGAAGG